MYVTGSRDNHGLHKEASHVTETDVLLPDKLNTFFAPFEDNTVPPTWPASKDCGLYFSVLTLARMPAQTESLAASSQSPGRPAGWYVHWHFQSLPIPVCCPHLLQDVHHCSCTQESKITCTHFCHNYLYLTRQASWEQVLIYNCNLAKIKQSSVTQTAQSYTWDKQTYNNTIEKSIYSVFKSREIREIRQ